MKNLIIIFIVFLLSTSIHSQSSGKQKVLVILNSQTNSWNSGDIEGFMEGYWKNDSLMFIGKNGVTYGWQNTLNNYKKSYPDKAAMGKLQFTILKVEKISNAFINVVGKWHLQRQQGDLQGHYTVLFRKIRGKWYIVQDHSS